MNMNPILCFLSRRAFPLTTASFLNETVSGSENRSRSVGRGSTVVTGLVEISYLSTSYREIENVIVIGQC